MFGFGRLGPMELILIFVIALLIFGPKKLPEIGKSLGSAIREFRAHSNKLTEELSLDETKAPAGQVPKPETSEATVAQVSSKEEQK
ncbi:twin-arginine translocase TatA/TatE family subunit [Sediminispirochaeta smaragdinae]|jgi:sec-independent protein translocase protein TatA|uniref:Sec-independent protein translocase protein TatA n=1 Tax=Sediminispirochaeta smaragdinae (strain DSM 11293 / JCM 15392 / SEBR 4228) TaxID=573413 RepID=E1R123_SEDSS|nr:twin-arginine translocase TatA/TatE family subunit [Sediminispirochaeta smaragdinae]ADK80272.1 twin-arginine translocation protein, TatA/E family subunit [Sediminispirochaeta smaragdinae DSM 11293]